MGYDSRDAERSRGQWYKSFDQDRMTIAVDLLDDDWEDEGDEEEIEFPATFKVCELCNGKGTHTNPSVDSHGISAEEFAEDPEFEEAYFAGSYDVNCYRCKGDRVEPKINEEYLSDKQKGQFKAFNDQQEQRVQDESYSRMEAEMERRMGC